MKRIHNRTYYLSSVLSQPSLLLLGFSKGGTRRPVSLVPAESPLQGFSKEGTLRPVSLLSLSQPSLLLQGSAREGLGGRFIAFCNSFKLLFVPAESPFTRALQGRDSAAKSLLSPTLLNYFLPCIWRSLISQYVNV